MKSDWYKTSKPGTYLVVPAGTSLTTLELPDEVRILIDVHLALPFAEDVDSHAKALRFNRVGVDDCLKHSGFCVLRH